MLVRNCRIVMLILEYKLIFLDVLNTLNIMNLYFKTLAMNLHRWCTSC